MTKNPLIPTATVDKNGRQTTVHKRMDAGGSSRSSSIPKVSLPSSKQDNCKLLVEQGFASELNFIKMSPNVRKKMMETLHEDTLPVMSDILGKHDDGFFTFRKAALWSAKGRHLAIVNGYVKLLNESENKDRDSQLDILYSLRGVQQCRPDKAMIDITNPDDKSARGALALIAAIKENLESGLIEIKSFDNREQSAYVFRDHEVGAFIIENPDHADEIVSLYRKHGHFNRGLFADALANDVKSLNEGVL